MDKVIQHHDAHAPYAKKLKSFDNHNDAFAYISFLYNNAIESLYKYLEHLTSHPAASSLTHDGFYPYVGIDIDRQHLHHENHTVFGSVQEPGVYGTTITHPMLFKDYLLEQMELLIANHGGILWVGESFSPIPLPFAIREKDLHDLAQHTHLRDYMTMPGLDMLHDDVVNGLHNHQSPRPLCWFHGERTDYSLARLRHYTGTDPQHFQRFILLTNYQRYTELFVSYAMDAMQKDPSQELVIPGNLSVHAQDPMPKISTYPQMPAYHLKRADGQGITLINMGVGPSNAKTMTDHLAVLRPYCWIMLGHCAGLRHTQSLGDYVLAHAYVRDDHVLDRDLPLSIPIPALGEIQMAIVEAVSRITKTTGKMLKRCMRTGTVASTDNRNWEVGFSRVFDLFKQSRAIAVDMESATVATNGFRFRVPYGTLLCVSDKPLHGELKLPGMAQAFYKNRIKQHLLIGIETINLLRKNGVEKMHSRKLRGYDDPPFR